MTREQIPFDQLSVQAHRLWPTQWMLLTSGDFAAGQFNTMTVGWGSLGAVWGRPFAQVLVRQVRYTFEFMEQYDTFTLCAFPTRYRKGLQLLGAQSGRDGDKIAQVGLTPIASAQVATPAFDEAELVIECRKIYWDDLDPAHFLDPDIERHYSNKHYHRIYLGQVLEIFGTSAYRAPQGD